MIIYNLSLERQNILGADKFSIAADSNKTVGFRFHFDRSWRIFDTKAAVFKSSENKYYVLDIVSDSVTVPWEVLRDTNGFDLAVVAYENEVVMTSRKVHIEVASSLLPEFCRQLTPTESLFNRIKDDARNEAIAEREDYINELQRQHSQEVSELNSQIASERQNAENIEAQKNAEIELINQQIANTETEHQSEIQALENELSIKTELAYNWELVENAMKQKTDASNVLWYGGTASYKLPMMDLSSVKNLNNFCTDYYLAEAGFKWGKITNMQSAFSGKVNMKKITLRDTENIVRATEAFYYCTHLQYADLGNFKKCTNIDGIFDTCGDLIEVSFGFPEKLTAMTKAFYNCYSLVKINGVFNNINCTSYDNTFYNCINLEEIRFAENTIIASINFGSCKVLSKDSMLNIINGLNSEHPATLTFSRRRYETNFTADEQSEMTNLVRNIKGWTLSLS